MSAENRHSVKPALERAEWKALAEADTLHMLPTEALVASIKHLATRLLDAAAPDEHVVGALKRLNSRLDAMTFTWPDHFTPAEAAAWKSALRAARFELSRVQRDFDPQMPPPRGLGL